MAKNLYINIDDDVTKIVRKIAHERDTDLTLVLPKQALLFFDIVNLKLLKRQAEDLGKSVSILTMDPKGQQKSAEAGFALKSFDDLKRQGPSMDGTRRLPRIAPLKAVPPTPKAVPKIVPPPPVPLAVPVQRPRIIRAEPISAAAPVAKKKNGRGMRNFFVLTTIIALVLIVLLTLVILPQAQITVYAHSQAITKDFEINLDAAAAQADPDTLTLPVKNITKEEVLSRQFDSTGKQNLGTKASGQVQIYNFTGKVLKLNASTTTLIAGAKNYRFNSDDGGIKPTGYFSGTKNINPTTLSPEVAITAVDGGEDSNLPAGTRFEIKNSALGSQQNTVYANSTTAITGGVTRLTSIVGQTDLDNATQALRNGAVAQASSELYSAQGLVFPDANTSVTVKTMTFDKNVNDQSINFTGTIDAQISGIAYNPDNLKKMLENRLSLTIGQDKYLASGDQEKITTNFKSFDPATGKGFLEVHFVDSIVANIDKGKIIAETPGKSAADLKEYLLSNPDIDGADIVFSPFWVKNVPRYSGKIYITVTVKSQ